ncbi:MAG: ATP-binding cassette domain-containing protein [Bacteroidetes bacterium]|nr:ATP-binding cassette domain-containing protein [Bacteroidota bacterium]
MTFEKQVLEVDSVLLEYGNKRILQDIYLKVETRKITGLLGRNGSGKSCLMRIIFGELSPLNKHVRINAKPILRQEQLLKHFSYLPQKSFIPGHLRLRTVMKHFEVSFDQFQAHFPEYSAHYNTRAEKLSGGQKRILEIFIVLKSSKPFCLLDEPFSQVSPLQSEKIQALIQEVKPTKGILITDHQYQYVTEICDELYFLKDGKTHLTNDIVNLEKLGYVKF